MGEFADSKQQEVQVRPVPIYGLKRFFEVLVRRSFEELWVWDSALADYVVNLLVRFVRTDALYRVGEVEKRPIETIAEFLSEISAQKEEGPVPTAVQRRRNLQQHLGDYALFMSGMFRAFLQRHRILDLYLVQGPRAYRRTASLDRQLYRSGARCFEALASEFERLSGALDYMRKVYFVPAVKGSPYRDLLDRFDRYS